MIRVAGPGDVEVVLELVRALAGYEREADRVAMTPADLQAALFGPIPAAYCLVATADQPPAGATPDGGPPPSGGPLPTGGPLPSGGPLPTGGALPAGVAHPPPVVGFAIWHPTFSTWTGQSGMHLIDLFVRPEHRRGGHGRALLAALATVCVKRGYRRLEWAVLDWNTPAQAFYRSLAARPLTGWSTWRVDGDALTDLAALGRPRPGAGTADPA
ncbi:acetyltransferase (GNAT) family protein [Frankia torreyi]|uniref:Acetyltransferase (GNAT) family protein n=1 Tax=Frankia torreyi TaxID=1856 RepID=A0A0D8BFL4_9ACTN|nr:MULTISPECIES: GNAT family N-acetyltransferase [Frankia]KJE22946.1 acetyltransferase (GNAT) family protein [Frankia torreyi]KQC36888.1 acetyltransferase [Frankia sp. ACN1ag]KQM04175.1 acetyltransferase (GNAT) family protein [Frankia sp. CpI1-P]